jgi:hypothetical protein
MSFSFDEAGAQHSFLHRMLKILAALGIWYGLLALTNVVAYFAAYGWRVSRPWPTWVPVGRGVSYSLYILGMGSISVIHVVGSWGLWRWRSWSRKVLIVWAVLSILFGIVNTTTYLISTFQALAAATQPTVVSVPYWVWSMISSLLTSATLALVTLLVMTQKTVADLWAPRGTSAFPVVPLAQPVVDHDVVKSTAAP